MGDASTLDEMFRERVRRSPENRAYSFFDKELDAWISVSWSEVAHQVERWQVALRGSALNKGDRVAICYSNSLQWVLFDQAALRLGLVVVPLYTADRADNIAYVINNSFAKLVLFESAKQWLDVEASDENINCLRTVVVTEQVKESADGRVKLLSEWLPEQGQHMERGLAEANDIASIVYTSGTTGRPKGVMLSHKNILSNAYSGMRSVALTPVDHLLSFLPLSHTLERTVGYYAAMLSGCELSFNRSIPELSEDIRQRQPSVMISVPRIFERVHNEIHIKLGQSNVIKRLLFKQAVNVGWRKFQYQQGMKRWHPQLLLCGVLDLLVARKVRDRLGGNLRFVIVGGAPLSLDVAKTFISLGIPLLQGYGLTESSPVISVNTLELNKPESIGLPLRGVTVKLMENDELWATGDSIMQGYWQNPEATAKTLEGEWLKTGDRGAIDEDGFIRIIGRIKDILVLANGEKVPPSDIESAIIRNPLFEQVLILGEGKSYLSAILVLNPQRWLKVCAKAKLRDDSLASDAARALLVKLVAQQMHAFPGYARVRKVHGTFVEWTVESGLMTPTLKVKRANVMSHFASEIDALYAGHGVHES